MSGSTSARVVSLSVDETFRLPTSAGAHTECAMQGCHGDPTDTRHALALTLEADMEGLAADYGSVAFCSRACFCRFHNLLPLRTVDNDPRGRTLINSPNPVLARVEAPRLPEPAFMALGHDVDTATRRVSTWLTTEHHQAFDIDLGTLSVSYEEF